MNNEEVDYVLVDTPGQIEVFTWSASGAIISEAMASLMPTVVVYVMDTQRSSSTGQKTELILSFLCSLFL